MRKDVPFIPLALFEEVAQAVSEHRSSLGKIFSATNGYSYFVRRTRLAKRIGPYWDHF